MVVVSDGRGDVLRMERIALSAALGGATAIVIREPGIEAPEKIAVTRRLLEVLRPRGVLVLLNDRIDVALAAGADGVQLGFRSLPLDAARRLAPRPFLLGFSGHEGDPLARVAEAGADFVFLGPVFDTPTKRGWKEALGPAKAAAIAATSPVPVVVIGGIEPSNAHELRHPAIAGIAVVRGVCEAPDPAAATRALRASLEGASGPG